jgi:pimeloyl-ACP methyl ester carboxylesterase
LIIPEVGRYPSSKGIVNSLRHTLSLHHWHTLALDMTSTLTKNGDINEDKVQKAIAAGVEYLNKQGVYNIAILGEGVGAAHALHYVAALPETDNATSQFQQIRALIMINAKNSIPYSDTDTLNAFDTVKLPILDAYSGNDLLSQEQAKLRKSAARRKMNRYHQQIRLPQMVMYQQRHENRTTKQIRGWLDKNIAGFMVRKQR